MKKVILLEVIMVMFVLAPFLLQAEEVCMFQYTNEPEEIDGDTLIVPFNTVAMHNKVKATLPSEIKKQASGGASIMFVFDNSSSMLDKDKPASRYLVASEFLDTLKVINPDIEVGMAVFQGDLLFKSEDDELFKPHTGWGEGAYLPLVNLSREYTSSVVGRKSGFDILQHYLQIRLYDVKYSKYTIKYEPSTFVMQATNISVGFDAAKSAFKSSVNPPKKQFIIFFSDGEAGWPRNDETYMNKYLTGEDTPTTYSFYYVHPGQKVPATLKTMTQNIKENGFSSSNTQSNIWPITGDKDAVFSLIMENVFEDILVTTVSGTPLEIEINGKKESDWEKPYFDFSELFPLKDPHTPFSYVIDYAISMDSILNGDTITTNFDTTTTVDFYSYIHSGDSVSDRVALTYWARSIRAEVDGQIISTFGGNSGELDIQFLNEKVDTLYDYDKVSLTLSTSSGDKETISLQQNGLTFSKDVSYELSPPQKSDGKIQLARVDTVYLYFENPKLPLDTLTATLYYSSNKKISIEKIIYQDTSANGVLDQVLFLFTGDGDADDKAEAVKEVQLPEERKVSIDEIEVFGDTVVVKLQENEPVTESSIMDYDFFIIEDSIELSSGTVLLPFVDTLKPIDKIAPVIVSASVIDSIFFEKHGTKKDLLNKGNDYLYITFSENVTSVSHTIPFDFYNTTDNLPYDVRLEESEIINREHRFLIKGENKVIEGDSIHISVGEVTDLEGNSQNDNANIKRVVTVDTDTINEYRTISLLKADAFDGNGDGFMDSVVFHFDQDEIPFYAPYILKWINLPQWRNLIEVSIVDSGSFWFSVNLKEDRNKPNTSTTDEDVLTITENVKIHKGTLLQEAIIDLNDSMAPVIIEADIFYDETLFIVGGKDSLVENRKAELSICFSESVDDVQSKRPFYLYRTSGGDNKYELVLSIIEKIDSLYRFSIDSMTQFKAPIQGDSIHIRWKGTDIVEDSYSNTQGNSKNRKVELNVEHSLDTAIIRLPYVLKPYTTILNYEEEISNTSYFESFESFSYIFDTENPSALIMQLRPEPLENVTTYDSFRAKISILDPLGNELIKKQECVFDEKSTSLLWLWNGTNLQGRKSGRGSYVALISVDYLVDDDVVLTEEIRHMIGIKDHKEKGNKE